MADILEVKPTGRFGGELTQLSQRFHVRDREILLRNCAIGTKKAAEGGRFRRCLKIRAPG
jgi:hypothetical protein